MKLNAEAAGTPKARAIVTGVIGGFFSGLTGVGGGVLMVPLLSGFLRLPQHVAHGTSLAVVLFAATAASAHYIARDDIDWELLPILLAGSVVGAYVGARFIVRTPAHHLRLLFGLVLLAAAVRMIIA